MCLCMCILLILRVKLPKGGLTITKVNKRREAIKLNVKYKLYISMGDNDYQSWSDRRGRQCCLPGLLGRAMLHYSGFSVAYKGVSCLFRPLLAIYPGSYRCQSALWTKEKVMPLVTTLDTFTIKVSLSYISVFHFYFEPRLMHQELKHFSHNMDRPGGRGVIFLLKVWVGGLGIHPEPLHMGL